MIKTTFNRYFYMIIIFSEGVRAEKLFFCWAFQNQTEKGNLILKMFNRLTKFKSI